VDTVIAVKAARKAVKEEGECFALLLDFYLKIRYRMGMELVAHDRRKFHRALADLMGRIQRSSWTPRSVPSSGS
jgi:hypothetical protein